MDRRLCVAPMMEWTDRHCRFFHRLLTRRALIYTEMLTTGAVLRGDRARLLGFDAFEHPVALQLGGSDPAALSASARIGEDFGYDEINLNVGCPSDRVQEGRFGACLMVEPALVADCVAAMKAAVKIPVTVKCRTRRRRAGSRSGAVFLCRGSQGSGRRCADRACTQGLAARVIAERKSRGAPARLCDRASAQDRASRFRDCAQRRHCQFGAGASAARSCGRRDDGPRRLSGALATCWLSIRCSLARPAPFASPKAAGLALIPYIERELAKGVRLPSITRHVLGLFRSVPGARAFRRHLATEAVKPGAGAAVMAGALAQVLDLKPELSNIAAA